MRQSVRMLMAITALTAGCGQANEKFDESFDKSFGESCVASATQSGVPAEIATKACDCSLAKINEKYSTSDKLTMSGQEAQPIMVACLNEAMKP